MTKIFKEIPDFNSDEEEREFWATHDSTEYIDWYNAEKAIFPKLKSSYQRLKTDKQSFGNAYKRFRNSINWEELDIGPEVFVDVRDRSTGKEENPWLGST